MPYKPCKPHKPQKSTEQGGTRRSVHALLAGPEAERRGSRARDLLRAWFGFGVSGFRV